MDKDIVEIKQRTKWVVLFLAACVLAIMVSGYGFFFTEKYRGNTTIQGGYVVGILLFFYVTSGSIKKLLKSQPIITIGPDSIILNNTSKAVIIPWATIQHIDVLSVEGEGYVVSIKTEHEDHQVGLAWLNTTHLEMVDLIRRYKPVK